MKNCRKKLKGVVGGSVWSDSEFGDRVRKITGSKKKSLAQEVEQYEDSVVTNADEKHAILVMRDFSDMEPGFCKVLSDDSSWEIEGEDNEGETKSLPYTNYDGDCC
jgi:hypothetical protein